VIVNIFGYDVDRINEYARRKALPEYQVIPFCF
jgi:hypothetical protein